MSHENLTLIGYAVGIAGADPSAKEGPEVLKNSPYLKALSTSHIRYHWENFFSCDVPHSTLEIVEFISKVCKSLAEEVRQLVEKQKFFAVIGGDHTSAIGSFNGMQYVLAAKGPIGLIWIDAHMDSHTPETSLSGRLHGMPLASLMGFGYPSLSRLIMQSPPLAPAHIALIGVRSFESGEALLLERLKVRIFFYG